MIILTTSANQTFPIIPTRLIDYEIEFIGYYFQNETTKEYFYGLCGTSLINDVTYLIIEFPTLLKENTFYNVVIYNTEEFNIDPVSFGEIFYKDRVFVTNQSQSSYSINNGQYTSPSIDNNNYITI